MRQDCLTHTGFRGSRYLRAPRWEVGEKNNQQRQWLANELEKQLQEQIISPEQMKKTLQGGSDTSIKYRMSIMKTTWNLYKGRWVIVAKTWCFDAMVGSTTLMEMPKRKGEEELEISIWISFCKRLTLKCGREAKSESGDVGTRESKSLSDYVSLKWRARMREKGMFIWYKRIAIWGAQIR